MGLSVTILNYVLMKLLTHSLSHGMTNEDQVLVKQKNRDITGSPPYAPRVRFAVHS